MGSCHIVNIHVAWSQQLPENLPLRSAHRLDDVPRVSLRSQEKILFKDVCCPLKLALYPKLNVLAFTSQGGQKFERVRSHDHVPLEVPPRP